MKILVLVFALLCFFPCIQASVPEQDIVKADFIAGSAFSLSRLASLFRKAKQKKNFSGSVKSESEGTA